MADAGDNGGAPCNVLYTVSTHFVLGTAAAGRYYYNLNLGGKKA